MTPRWRAFGDRRRWIGVGVAVIAVAALVSAAVIGVQSLTSRDRAAEALSALNIEETALTDAQARATSARDDHAAALAAARDAADSAAPALAAVAGMSDEALRGEAEAEAAVLTALLDEQELAAAPAAYDRGDLDRTDAAAISAAAAAAAAETRDLDQQTAAAAAARRLVERSLAALTAAQHALGESLPATAAALVEENDIAEQGLREAVVDAAAAVGAAHAAGGRGDAELISYAEAVAVLRDDQQRAVEEREAWQREQERLEQQRLDSGGWYGVVEEPAPQEPEPAPEPEPEPEPDEPIEGGEGGEG